MNITLVRALAALVPSGMLLFGSFIMFLRTRKVSALLQLVGATGLVLVVLAHLCEAIHLLPWMHWGAEDSAGHYFDLGSATLGFVLFPVGYFLQALASRPSEMTT